LQDQSEGTGKPRRVGTGKKETKRGGKKENNIAVFKIDAVLPLYALSYHEQPERNVLNMKA
jgi:hypothetical protein